MGVSVLCFAEGISWFVRPHFSLVGAWRFRCRKEFISRSATAGNTIGFHLGNYDLTVKKTFLAAAAFYSAGALAATTVYSQNFNAGASAEWSSQLWTSTGSLGQQESFLGAFDDWSTRLTLSSLPQHDRVTLSFDLYLFGTTYGNFDPAIWTLRAGTPGSLDAVEFSSTFSNVLGFPQAYPSTYPLGNNAAFSGVAQLDPFYYGMPGGVSRYHLTFDFIHTADELAVDFQGQGFLPTNGPTFGRWGLDNVQVEVGKLPEPNSGALTIFALALIAGRRLLFARPATHKRR